MNDCLTLYIETDITSRIDNENIMQQFQNMKQYRRLFSFFFFLFMSIYLIYILFKILYNLCFY